VSWISEKSSRRLEFAATSAKGKEISIVQQERLRKLKMI
jgi:hypothetical protein